MKLVTNKAVPKLEIKRRNPEPEFYSPLALSYAVMDTYQEIIEGFPVLRPCPIIWDTDKKMVQFRPFSFKNHLPWLLVTLVNNCGLFGGPHAFIATNRILRQVTKDAWNFDDGVPNAMAVIYCIAGLTVTFVCITLVPFVWKFQDFKNIQNILVCLAKQFVTTS